MEATYDFKMSVPKIQLKDNGENEFNKTFIIEPLESGFGLTLGNALRRIALSSLPGGAVKKFKIKGVSHEYDVIPNCVEDVTSVILALKDLKLRISSQDEEIILNLKGNKKGELKAKDIEGNSDVEIINPELKIVTLADDSEFEMEITVVKGRGYVLADENRGKEKKSQDIFVDSIFTPVTKFSYKVEDTRVGDKTNYDKLIIDISTNGMLSCEETISYSAHILQRHADVIKELNINTSESKVFKEEKKVEIVEEIKEPEDLTTSIETLDISNRAYNGLKRSNIHTIEELIIKSKKEISSLDNIGSKTVDEIEMQLSDLGLAFEKDE